MIGKTIGELKIGDSAKFSKTIAEADVYMFAGVTGDLNPAHINEAYASQTFFEKRIAHGILLAGFISTVIGNQLPGYGTIYVKQDLNFLAPAYFGDTITAKVEVIEIILEKKLVRLKTSCVNQKGLMVLDGEAVVSPPRAPKKKG